MDFPWILAFSVHFLIDADSERAIKLVNMILCWAMYHLFQTMHTVLPRFSRVDLGAFASLVFTEPVCSGSYSVQSTQWMESPHGDWKVPSLTRATNDRGRRRRLCSFVRSDRKLFQITATRYITVIKKTKCQVYPRFLLIYWTIFTPSFWSLFISSAKHSVRSHMHGQPQ